ncbi:unnamed protein product [Cunninghamella blakesleeana]
MPFDTVDHSHKRIRYDGSWQNDQDFEFQFVPSQINLPFDWDRLELQSNQPTSYNKNHIPIPPNHHLQDAYWKKNYATRQRKESETSTTSTTISEDDNYSMMMNHHNYYYSNHQDNNMNSPISPTNTNLHSLPSPVVPSNNHLIPQQQPLDKNLRDLFNKCSVSYSSTGLNLETKITNATELRSLIDTFSKLCSTSSSMEENTNNNNNNNNTSTTVTKGITLYRNKLYKSKPVNFFASVCELGHMMLKQVESSKSSSKSPIISLKQIADACIDTFFCCWVRYSPIINKKEFMTWYNQDPHPEDSLVVNAICAYVFNHAVIQHTQPCLEMFLHDEDLILQQQETFFERARQCLESSFFDTPDRYSIVALLLMSCIAKPEKRYHYAGMAMSALLELDIYPRMVDDNNDCDNHDPLHDHDHHHVDSFQKEMDTRLWWYAWSIDFYLYSAGTAKNTPKTLRQGEVDSIRVFEEDIDETEHGILADQYCLKWWRFQADCLSIVYQQESEMTAEQLRKYDNQLLEMYQSLPNYLKLDSGFTYGCEELFLVCVRVNVEFNATRLILHMPFLPEANDPHPTQVSLQSLNVCLKTALIQLRTINTCNEGVKRRCGFDRDELWRAGEIISLSMDVYRNCVSIRDKELILRDITMDEYRFGLHKASSILHLTKEYKLGRRDWVQVSDWLKSEIERHDRLDNSLLLHYQQQQQQQHHHHHVSSSTSLNSLSLSASSSSTLSFISSPTTSISSSLSSSTDSLSSPTTSPISINNQVNFKNDYFIANLKPNKQQESSTSSLSSTTTSIKNNNKKLLSSFSTTTTTTTSSSSSIKKSSSSSIKKSSPLPSSSLSNSKPIQFSNTDSTEFISFSPDDDTKQSKSKKQPRQQQARFRYFNPRTMNKFLFIDDHPLL